MDMAAELAQGRDDQPARATYLPTCLSKRRERDVRAGRLRRVAGIGRRRGPWALMDNFTFATASGELNHCSCALFGNHARSSASCNAHKC
jgi:hypothetical protein